MGIRSLSSSLLALGLALGWAGSAPALQACKAKIQKDGTVEVSANEVDGPLRWGNTPEAVDKAFSDTSCLSGNKARKCTLGPEGSLARITPPASCTVHLADDSDTCAAFIPKCIPGLRQPTALLGEIRMFAGPQPPPGWAFCLGQLVLIADLPGLFSILGTTYGGDGATTFGLPDLRGRAPVGAGAGPGLTNRDLGVKDGAETVVLDVTHLASHSHTLRATNSAATQTQPAGNILATGATPQYLNASTSVVMGTDSIGASGSNAPHPNVPPILPVNFIIAVEGFVPQPVVE